MYQEGDEFDSQEFRRGLWRQTTTAVALVTSAADGRTNVMACEWAMMVSHRPVCFAIAIHPMHETHKLIEASGEFGLSFCTDSQARLSHLSGSNSLRDVDKWSLADFPIYQAHRIAAPMVDEAVLNVECRLVGRQDLGHTLFVGEAVWARFDPEVDGPLLFHGGKYFRIGDQVPKS